MLGSGPGALADLLARVGRASSFVDADGEPACRCRFLRVRSVLHPNQLQWILRGVGTVEDMWCEEDALVVRMACTRQAAMAKWVLHGQIVCDTPIYAVYDRDAADQLKAWAERDLSEAKKRKRDAEADAALEKEALRREREDEVALYGEESVRASEDAETASVEERPRPPAHPLAGDRGGRRRATRELALAPEEINIVPVPKPRRPPSPPRRRPPSPPRRRPPSPPAPPTPTRTGFQSAPPPSAVHRSAVQLAELARNGEADPVADVAHARLAAWKAAKVAAAVAGTAPAGPRSLAAQWDEEQDRETPQEKAAFRPGLSHPLAAQSQETAKRSTKAPSRSL